MSPSHARKGNTKYRYYLSSALLTGAADCAGSVRRAVYPSPGQTGLIAARIHTRCNQYFYSRGLTRALVELRVRSIDRGNAKVTDGLCDLVG